jgi:hypothetical protein
MFGRIQRDDYHYIPKAIGGSNLNDPIAIPVWPWWHHAMETKKINYL